MRNIKRIYFIFIIFMLLLSALFFSNKAEACHQTEPKSNNENIKNKIIYLTFDDGPSSPVTDKVLDILKKKQVKATFFIIGKKIKNNQKLIKRINNEGHGIGLHSFTHDSRKMYSSDNAFIEEMNMTSDELNKLTGKTSKCIRFPFGSKKHLTKHLYIKLSEKDYRIYDWNARISDGIYPYISPEVFLREAINSSKKWSTVFMLMHCDIRNINTCKVLPRIIDYFKKENYTFKIIDNNTPEYFFKFKR